jgi:large subunit ribosomal protein L35e
MVEKKVCQKIRDSEAEAIRANIDKLKDELRTLRNSKASSGSATKLAKIKTVRRNIARNLTILNQKERANLAGKLHQGSGKRAIFLRTKLTRAVRRSLTTHQKSKLITKVQKRQLNFPVRKYGLRA